MSAQDIVLIIGAVTASVTAIIAAIASLKNSAKLTQAAQRREEIASSPPGAPEPPSTLAPPRV